MNNLVLVIDLRVCKRDANAGPRVCKHGTLRSHLAFTNADIHTLVCRVYKRGVAVVNAFETDHICSSITILLTLLHV